MAKVRDIMSSYVIAIKKTATIDAAIDLMLSNGISGVPVVDEGGAPVGVISEYDVLQLYMSDRSRERVMEPCSRFMNRKLRTIQASARVSAAVNVFRTSNLRRLIVLDKDKLVGVLSRRDIIRDIRKQRSKPDSSKITGRVQIVGN